MNWCCFGLVYRTAHGPGHRRAADEQPIDVDHVTGLPKERSGYLPPGLSVPGRDVARTMPLRPDKLAVDHLGLTYTLRRDWDEADAEAVSELTLLFKKVARRFAERGWVREAPPVSFYEKESGVGRDGYAFVFHFTEAGLAEADRRVPGTKYDHGPFSSLANAPESVVTHAKTHLPYAIEMLNKERTGRDGS